ncbi:MAG: hypothetical protein J6O62_03655 [Bacilli bacterium]|nr:hypothetical protein [Bacilli bacterium]MBO6194937.1 hypothetical protein [Bacilli bacterium]
MANIFLERFPINKKNIKKFLEKNINKLSGQRITSLLLESSVGDRYYFFNNLYEIIEDEDIKKDLFISFSNYFYSLKSEMFNLFSEETKYNLLAEQMEVLIKIFSRIEVENMIKLLSDENKERILNEKNKELKSYFSDNIIADIILSISDDNKKMELTENFLSDRYDYFERQQQIIVSLSNDEIKEEYLDKIIDKFDNYWKHNDLARIISTMEDSKKEELIEKYRDRLEVGNIIEIIKTMQDENKERMMEKYSDIVAEGNYRYQIVKSFNNEETKVRMLEKYDFEMRNKLEIIREMSYDGINQFLEKNYDNIINGNEAFGLYNIAKTIPEDKLIEFLNKYKDKLQPIDPTQHSMSGFYLLELLREKPNLRVDIIDTCNDKFDNYLYDAIMLIQDNQIKERYIFKYANNLGENLVIPNISQDKIIEYFKEYESGYNIESIYKIILKISDENKVLYTQKYLDSLSDDNIIEIINSIKNVKNKADILNLRNVPIEKLELTPDMLDVNIVRNMYLENLKGKINGDLPASDEMCVQIGKYLLQTNDEILKTIDPRLFSQKYLQMFSKEEEFESLRVIGRYPGIQDKIIKLGERDYALCNSLIKNIINIDCDYTKVLNDILTKAFLEEESALLMQLSKYNFNEVELNNFVQKLIYVTSNLNNILNPLTVEKVINYEKIIEDISDNQLRDNDIEKVKEAILLKRFGIDYETAKNLLDKFAFDLKSLDTMDNPIYEKIKILLTDIKFIMNESDVRQLYAMSKLEKKNISFDTLVILEATCRKMYGEQLSSSLSKISDMKKVEDKVTSCSQDVYLAFDENKNNNFTILLTSLGAYTGYEKPDNYKKDWLRPKLGTHGFCASLISNEMMGTARIKYTCLGFDNIPISSLLLQGPYDLGSGNTEMDITTDDAYDRSKYLSPKAMIDNTRHTHNELVIERLIKEGKLLPNYVIYMTEEYDKEKIVAFEKMSRDELNIIEKHLKDSSIYRDEDIAPLQSIFKKYGLECEMNEIEKMCIECQTWVNSVQAANDFEIPIVVIERKKIREHEIQEINKMKEEFKNTHNANTMIDMLIRFENNRAGCRLYYEDSGFKDNDENKLVEEIFSEIDSMIENGNLTQAQVCINELDVWYKKESENVNMFFSFDMKDKLKTYKEDIYGKQKEEGKENIIMNIDDIDYKQEINEIKESGFEVTGKVSEEQYSISDVEKKYDIVSSIVQASISDEQRKVSYDFESKSHGERHIQDVILFTALVGQKSLEGDNKGDLLKVSIEASKYHDCGRENDRNRGHAEAGAIKSYEILKEKEYTPLELAMIYTAIYNHEFRGSSYSMEEFKEQLKESSEKRFKDSFMGIVKEGNPNAKIEYTEEEYQEAINNNSNKGDMNTDKILDDVMQVVTLVRDADALDRTRFLDSSRASLNPEFLSPEAKKFVDFSYTLAEHHATKDLAKMKEEGTIDDDLIRRIKADPSEFVGKEVSFKITTNKEVIKFIRDNNLYMEGVSYR